MTEHAASVPGKFLEIPIVIRFGDTDPFGVVYFVSYFRYCHHAVEEFFRHLGIRPEHVFRNIEEGFGLPVAGASCDFYRPMRYGDNLHVAIYITQARSKSITFGFRFYNSETAELVGQGNATLVTIDAAWRSRAIPDGLRDALSPYLPPVEVS